ncbi:hypothetical protein [Persicobacter diffluens]|uniref:Ligand-binding SRPBCC domain-containing protein n=1 Tax=Persicobacter diffluens TaxID=981 RepID=A0AAN5AI28_9BACT|nr:hypothetical protein PEDI_00210 [Persicobacter diffluens]
MRLKINTRINAPLELVQEHFAQDLFEQLNPPFPKAAVLVYEGNYPGARVELEIDFLLFKQKWISEITTVQKEPDNYSFIDEGRQLPFFLKNWHHHHLLLKKGVQTEIVDDIQFSSGNSLLDLLLYPGLLIQFLYRKPIYKSYFNSLSKSLR